MSPTLTSTTRLQQNSYCTQQVLRQLLSIPAITESDNKLKIPAEVIQSLIEEANTVVSVDPVEVVAKKSGLPAGFKRSFLRNEAKLREFMEESV